MKRVLLVEDQWPFIPQQILENLGGFSVSFVQEGDKALALFLSNSYDLVLLDLRLPGLSGLAILEGIKRIEPELPVIVVSAWTDKRVRARALELGAAAFFQKPPDYRKLHAKMVELVGSRDTRRRNTLKLEGEQAVKLSRMRRLNLLKERQARMGIATPPDVLIEIEDLEAGEG